MILEFLKALFYGIVEGITEWLPVSSTGHLILLAEWVPFGFSDNASFLESFWEMFEVVIQFGAILAVVVLFRKRLIPFGKSKTPNESKETLQLWGRVLLACLPAATVGVLGDQLLEKWSGKDIDGWCYNATVVAGALILYGIAFIAIERAHRTKIPKIERVGDISCRTALWIGFFQVLSLIPGTSRSGSTILGAILLGVSRTAAAEFSFFLAIPVMAGAGGLKMMGFLHENGSMIPGTAWGILAVGLLSSFLVSMAAIKFLTDFVKRHSFAAFGVYRILLGAAVLTYFAVIG